MVASFGLSRNHAAALCLSMQHRGQCLTINCSCVGRRPTGYEDRRRNRGRIDAGSRRVTRAERKQRGEAAIEAGRPEKEEILEVGSEGMSVQDLADKIAVPAPEIVKALFMKGIMAQVNQVLDFETVQIAAEDFEVEILEKGETRLDDLARKTVDYLDEDDLELLQSRPPVVVVMGHVDHGKVGSCSACNLLLQLDEQYLLFDG